MAQKYRTVHVDGQPTRVRYQPKRRSANERNAGLMPSRVQDPDTVYRRHEKHRYNVYGPYEYEED